METFQQPMPARYRVQLHRAMGCYFARVLEIPGCVARGATEVEAIENARGAIRFHLWVAQVLAEARATVQVEIGP
jgi:predicted RNase H-like HicB family nuclease